MLQDLPSALLSFGYTGTTIPTFQGYNIHDSTYSLGHDYTLQSPPASGFSKTLLPSLNGLSFESFPISTHCEVLDDSLAGNHTSECGENESNASLSPGESGTGSNRKSK